MDLIVGIDLGTTNSEVALVREGQPHVFEEDGDPILPSFVGLSEEGRLLIGKAARNQWIVSPERTIKSIKRKMGQDVKVKLGDHEFRPQEISALILKALKDRAEKALGQEVKKAVITVPAYFNEGQRQATKEAGELAGLEVVRILNEPTAASLTYDPNHQEMRRLLVYDLGGGTFDVSIVQAQEGVVEVLSSHGDTQLGGDDFDDLLLKMVSDRFEAQHGIDLRQAPVARARLLRAVEEAKKTLSFQPFARIEEEFLAEKEGTALHLNLEISRTEYEDLIAPLLERTMLCVDRALQDAKLTPRQIDKVVLVGGSTRTPRVSELLEEKLGQPAHQEVNPDLCVAMGAAIQSGMIAGQDVGAVLVDITPHSLGIATLDERTLRATAYSRVIHRNTPLPATRSEVYFTSVDRQNMVRIEVYQGEDDDTRRNHRIGAFTISGLAPVPAGNQLVVTFELSLDGILKVSAREKATGLSKQATIDKALSPHEQAALIEQRDALEDLWDEAFGEEDEDDFGDAEDELDGEDLTPTPTPVPVPVPVPAGTDGHREAIQARALLEKAERMVAKLSAEDRADVEKLMERVRAALAPLDAARLTTASNELADALFYLEDA
jgi:molecular chaperone DnaK